MIRLFLMVTLLLCSVELHAQDFAIVNARLAQGDPAAAPVTIVVADGVIASIGPAAAPAGTPVIDAGGWPVTMPLFAAATQIGLSELGGTDAAHDEKKRRGGPDRELLIARAFNPNALTVQQARAEGVGQALIYPDSDDALFAGLAGIASLNARDAMVIRPAAALFVAEESGSNFAGGSMAGSWDELREVLRGAAEAKPEAPHNRRGHRATPALAAVASGAIPIVMQVNREADLRQAIEITQEFGLRSVIHGGAEAWRVADELAAADIAVILDPLDDLPFYYDQIGARRDNAALLSQAGVRIAFFVSGQGIYRSWNVGESLRLGAGVAVRNGLPRSLGLAAITSAPALIFASGDPADDTLHDGIKVGAPADLVIWDGDPLEPASAVHRQFRRGEEVSSVTRQTLLRDRYAPGAAKP